MRRLEHAKDWGEVGWDRFFEDTGTHWRNKDYRFLADVFDLSGLRGSLLDAGCALGDGQPLLYSLCHDVTEYHACDFSDQAIETCQRNPALTRTTFFQHDLQLPIPSSFDNIICLQTLEHVPAPEKAFANLLSATRKVLIVGTPYRNRRPDENHLWSFDKSDFRQFWDSSVIGQAGLNIYWMRDKTGSGYAFRRHPWRRLKDAMRCGRRIIAHMGFRPKRSGQ